MKFIYLICFISIFQLLLSVDLGGIKFAITEKMAREALDYFYTDINKEITKMQLEDIRVKKGINIRNIEIGIPNFTKDKVKFTFKENGINIKISGIKAWASATLRVSRYIIAWHNNIHIDVKEFNLEANLRVTGKKVDNKIIPWAEFIQPPTHTINFDVDIDGFMFGLNGAVESKAKSMLKDEINDFIENKSNKFLEDSLAKIPTDFAIDSKNGLYIDYTLVENIKMKTGYLEVNSYAFFYSKKDKATQNKKNFPLSLVPPITSIDNPNQVFISQYSINSALLTYTIIHPLTLKLDIDDYILGLFLPSLLVKYPGDKYIVYLEIPRPALDFEENYISSDIKGYFRVHIEDKNNHAPVFVCAYEASIQVEIVVIGEKTITGKVNDINIKVGQVPINQINTEVLIEHINDLKPFALNAINKAIKDENISFTLPSFFLNVKVKHKSKYIAVDYILGKITKF